MTTRTSWETNGLCEFILATFPILFRGIYIYIYGSGGGVQLRRHIALERREEGREFVFTRESRANHARPAKSALTKMSLAAGTSRTHPFVSILCQVPIRAVSRTALYNEGTRRKGENGAHREKKGWRKREREGRRA